MNLNELVGSTVVVYMPYGYVVGTLKSNGDYFMLVEPTEAIAFHQSDVSRVTESMDAFGRVNIYLK